MLAILVLQITPGPLPPAVVAAGAPIISDEVAKWLLGIIGIALVAFVSWTFKSIRESERERISEARAHQREHVELLGDFNELQTQVRLHEAFLQPQIVVYQRHMATALFKASKDAGDEDIE